MIDLSESEATAVFSAILPKFQLDNRGQYRGPAAHRNGDNPTALWVDVRHGGRFYDHVVGEGGDTIKFGLIIVRSRGNQQ